MSKEQGIKKQLASTPEGSREKAESVNPYKREKDLHPHKSYYTSLDRKSNCAQITNLGKDSRKNR